MASSAPHWPALDDPDDVLVDVASAGSAPHWPTLGCVNVDETSAGSAPHWPAWCGVDDDVEEIYLPSPLLETLCTNAAS